MTESLKEMQERIVKSHEWMEHGDLFKCSKCGKITGNPTVEDSTCNGRDEKD